MTHNQSMETNMGNYKIDCKIWLVISYTITDNNIVMLKVNMQTFSTFWVQLKNPQHKKQSVWNS